MAGTPERNDPYLEELCAVFARLKTGREVENFLRDIATPTEISAFTERWRIARLLDAGDASYREIAARTGASTTTVARVNRFLRDESWRGYRSALDATPKQLPDR